MHVDSIEAIKNDTGSSNIEWPLLNRVAACRNRVWGNVKFWRYTPCILLFNLEVSCCFTWRYLSVFAPLPPTPRNSSSTISHFDWMSGDIEINAENCPMVRRWLFYEAHSIIPKKKIWCEPREFHMVVMITTNLHPSFCDYGTDDVRWCWLASLAPPPHTWTNQNVSIGGQGKCAERQVRTDVLTEAKQKLCWLGLCARVCVEGLSEAANRDASEELR